MGFSMRINFVDVICDDSLRNSYINGLKNGYEFDIRLSYYRGLFLSCVNSFALTVDGEEVPNSEVTFSINGKEFFVDQLSSLSSEFWQLLEPAKIKVLKKGGLPKGSHNLKLDFYLRVPYLPLPGGDNDHNYVPLDSCGEKELIIEEIGGE